ncbi:hypothetical protein A3D77_04125 [Candidatus Gottesmanbacteria bacterium RIFCSPHIGHO2_02_FULL_39_11]|uniref:Methyltransferase type 11 domain-containing protein n=1 Tax=Candidatus Gottesmanbacteria bacterium RIFCSPHIGHO2_02_FULL_39_11 TaxID=1798382 RepID=A0A1F5ZJJ8_9BACT|nr:MAG: hypothetical protein A3D77_04125 [Candidatus Gottesmanbacteria bacterium RIFCSPHIGHO2_02_FULL_39_11]
MKYTVFNPTPFESHRLVLDKINENSKVLDLGCATGYFDRELIKKDCEVYGVDVDAESVKEAKKYCRKTAVLDLERTKRFPFGKNSFDYILMLDLIEHLKNPENLLITSKKYLKKEGKIIISTPNIAFISIRLALLRGKFQYSNLGIMDETHVKFFTRSTLEKLIKDSGLKIAEMDCSSGFSQITQIGKYLNYLPKYIQYEITRRWMSFLAYQFIVTCTF